MIKILKYLITLFCLQNIDDFFAGYKRSYLLTLIQFKSLLVPNYSSVTFRRLVINSYYLMNSMDISPINAVKSVTLVQQGVSERQIAQQLNVSQSAVSKVHKRFIETGSYGRRQGIGRNASHLRGRIDLLFLRHFEIDTEQA